jgi:sodium transport system permease protein
MGWVYPTIRLPGRGSCSAPGRWSVWAAVSPGPEYILTPPQSPDAAPRGDPYLEGLATALVAITLFLAGRLLLSDFGLVGVAVAEWVALAGFPVAVLLVRRRNLRDGLALRGAPPGAAPATVLLGLGALPLAWSAFWMASAVAPVDPGAVRILGRELVAQDGGELVPILILAAVTPAVCEELLFRGLLLGTLLDRHTPFVAVGASAAVFALLHWTPEASARMAPTLVLGLLLGWAVWRSGSIWVGVLTHLVYNATLLVGAAWSVGPGLPRPEAPPTALVLTGIALLAAGTHVLMIRSPHPPADARS